MGIWETGKELFSLAQKADNLELIRKVLEIQQEASELDNENRELKERVRSLEENLAVKEKLQYRHNAMWTGEGSSEQNGPFCSGCWDVKNLVVRLTRNNASYATCPNCKTVVQYADDFDEDVPIRMEF